MMRMLLIAVVAGAASMLPARAHAQAKPAAPAQQPAAAATAAPTAAAPDAPDAYRYETAGRRDPFINLLGTGGDARAASHGGDGPAGLAVDDITVRGVMQSRGGLIAMVQGPDNKTYIVHRGDKFLDGGITQITPQGLVVLQDVNDPLSLVKQREIRKMLRSIEGAKE